MIPHLPTRLARRLLSLRRRRAAGPLEYGVLASLIVLAALGAVMLVGERTRGIFASDDLEIAAAPPPGGGGSGLPQTPPGAGAWSGDGTFTLVAEDGPETRVFVLTNVGQGPLFLGLPAVAGPGAAAFVLLGSDCPAVLPPGESCAVTLRATAAANGRAEALLQIPGVPGGLGLVRNASGFEPRLAWTGPATFAIDGALGGGPSPRTAEQTLTLVNQGALEATGLSVAVSGEGFSLGATTCTATLAPGASCTATIVASVTGNRLLSGSLSSGGPVPATETLSGIASGFVLLLTWTDDGTSIDTATPPGATRIYTLTNAGTATSPPLAGLLRLEGAGADAFALTANACVGALDPGQACTTGVRLAAGAPAGTHVAQLRADVPGGTAATVEGAVIGAATPAPFAIAALTGQPGNVTVVSAPVSPTGFNIPVMVSVSGDGQPEVSTDGGATWGGSATLSPGGALRIRLQTGTPDGGTRTATVVAGGRSVDWTVGVVDQTPDAFAFAPRTGEDLSIVSTSNPITPVGYAVPAPVSITGEGNPQISIEGGPWTSAGTISPGQTLAVRLLTSDLPFSVRSATVTIGGLQTSWSVTTGGSDTTPDAFTIPTLNDQTPDAPAISAPVLLAGFDAPLDLSVTGEGAPQVSTNGGATWAASARLRPGQTFLVRLTAGPEGTTRGATVVAGGVSAPWSVQARVRDTTPAPFAIPPLSGLPGNALVESAPVTPTGYTDPAAISVAGAGSPQISIAGGAWATAGVIAPGQSFRVRMTTAEPDGLSRSATVTVGGITADWTTQTIDTMHDPFGAISVANVPIGECTTGPMRTYTGFTSPAPFTAATNISGHPNIFGALTSTATGVMDATSGFMLTPGIQMQHRLCASPGTPPGASATIAFTIGGRTTNVTATTVLADYSPDVFSIPVASNVTPGTTVFSAPFQIPGITDGIPIGFASETQRAGAQFRINGGAPQASLLTAANADNGVRVGPNDTVQLVMTAPGAGQTLSTILRVGSTALPGGASFTLPWTVTTAAPDSMPDPWPDLTVSRAPNNQFAPAAHVSPPWPQGIFRITGINTPVQATIELLTSHPGARPFWLNCEGESRADGTNGTGVCGGQTITIQPNQGLRPVVTSSQVPGEVMTFRITIGQRSQTFTVTSTGSADITPDAFSIPAVAGAEPGAEVVSVPVLPTGLDPGVTTRIAVSGDGSPTLSIDGGPWIQAGLLVQGQSVRVRLNAAPVADGTTRIATLTIGTSAVPGQSEVSAPFAVTTADRTPDPIAFAPAADVEPGVFVESAAATISGLGGPVSFSVADGLASIDGGPFVASGTAANGQSVRLRLTAGPHGETRTATLTIGTASPSFVATTRALDTTPDAFAIPPLADMPAGVLLQSSWVRPTGLLDPAPFSVTGGELLPEGGAWSTAGVLEPGQRFRVRLTSAPAGQSATATVTIGGVSADFVVSSSP